MTTFTKCNYCKRGNKHVSLNCTRAKSTPFISNAEKSNICYCNQGNSYKIILTRYPTFSDHAHKSASSYEQNQVEFHHAASSVAFSLQVVVRARSVLHRGASVLDFNVFCDVRSSWNSCWWCWWELWFAMAKAIWGGQWNLPLFMGFGAIAFTCSQVPRPWLTGLTNANICSWIISDILNLE